MNYHYFMCLVDIFAPGNAPDIDCSDYCETVDEECTRSNLRGAQCSDAGCHGGGTPRCTPFCRVDYSPCESSANETSFELHLLTDSKGIESYWQIRNESDSSIIFQSSVAYESRDVITEFRCMNRDKCYEFELFDVGEDGICCGENNDDFGNYSILVDGDAVSDTNPSFGSSIIHSFGDCDLNLTLTSNAPSLSPVTLTISPSLHTSLKPSITSSLNQSMIPSLIPSIDPSLSSSEPIISMKPSSEPTSSSSSSSSNAPSIDPTNAPTSLPSLSHAPSVKPSISPTPQPSSKPSYQHQPSILPSSMPSISRHVKLLVPDGAAGDEFGRDVAISTSTNTNTSIIAVSAPKSGNGKVYLFSLSVHSHSYSWEYEYLSMLEAPDKSELDSDEFGSSIAIFEDTLVIGAVKGNKAYIVSVSGAFASVILTSSSASSDNDGFGSSIDIESDTIVIGAPNDNESGDNSGAAYIYSTAGTFVRKIIIPSVAIDANDHAHAYFWASASV